MTFCDQISDETKAEMEKLIRYSKETGNEHGIKLCRINDKIVNSKWCAGDKSSIPIDTIDKIFCPVNSEYISEFHTHPQAMGNKRREMFKKLIDSGMLVGASLPEEIYEKPSSNDIARASSLLHDHTCVSSGRDNTYCYKIPKKIIDLAWKTRQNVSNIESLCDQLEALQAAEGPYTEKSNLLIEEIHGKECEHAENMDAIGDASDDYSLSSELIEDRCKVNFESNDDNIILAQNSQQKWR